MTYRIELWIPHSTNECDFLDNEEGADAERCLYRYSYILKNPKTLFSLLWALLAEELSFGNSSLRCVTLIVLIVLNGRNLFTVGLADFAGLEFRPTTNSPSFVFFTETR